MTKKIKPQDTSKLRSHISPILLSIFATGLAGCSSAPSLQTPNQSTTSGTVVKGRLENAEVFIDVDGDGVWTQGTDSDKATTNALGEYSITSDKTGDIVAVTNSSTIDKSSGEILDGVTLSAPEGYDVISVASTLTNEIMDADSSKTSAQAEADVKSLLGISSSIDIASFNPFDTGVNATDAANYEKVAQQVMTIVNGLATTESSLNSSVSATDAFKHAFDAMLDVVTASIAQPTITPLDFTSSGSLVTDVIAAYDSTSVIRTGNTSTVTTIKNAINATNDEIDNITSLGAGSKKIFSAAQKDLPNAIESGEDIEATVDSKLSEAAGNTVPTVTDIADQTAVEDIAITLNVSGYFTDADGDTLTFTMQDDAPAGLTIDANTGVISGTPTNNDVGEHSVTIVATDSNNGRVVEEINIEIVNTNDAVTLGSAIADASTAEDASYSYDTATHFDDVDTGDTGTYSMSGAPSNLTINSATGVISGTPDNDDVSTHTITVTRTDAGGTTASDTFDLTVTNTNDAPTLTSSLIADDTTDTSTAVNITVTTAFTDMDGDSLTYSMSGAPAGLAIDASTGVISGTASVAGTHTITVTADDSNGGTVSDSFDLNVEQKVTGAAIKGELDNALVFIDADGDGIWTEGVDSQQVRTDASGIFTLTTHIRGDLVVTTDENTIDTSSGATLTGVTLTAPEGYSVISVATTLTNQLINSEDSTLTEAEAEAKVKTLLGIDDGVDVTTFNPYHDDNAGSAEAIAYEKKAQQVMTVVNTLAEAESSSSDTVDKGDALGNALDAFVSVVAEQDTSSNTPMDLTAGIVDQVVAAYGKDSGLKTGLDTSVLGAIETAIETVNTAIETVTSLDADSKQLFAAAQVALLDTTKDVAASGDASRITIDENTDVSALVIIQGAPEGSIDEDATPTSGNIVASDAINIMGLDVPGGDTVTYTNQGFTGSDTAKGNFTINSSGTWTYTIDPTLAAIDGMVEGQTFSESFKVQASVTKADTSTGEAFKIITVYVDGENDTPTVSSTITGVNIDEGTALTSIDVSGHFDDVESTSLKYKIDDSAKEWLTIDTNTGAITGTPENDQVGTQTITVTATDEQGASVSTTFDIVVANVNDAPTITSLAKASVAENGDPTAVIYTATATDIDASDTLTYSLEGTDAGAFTIDASSGEIKLKTAADYETKASYNVTVKATDDGTGALSDSQDLVISVTDVNDAPTITSAATNSVDENLPTSSIIYTATSTDPEGEAVLYALSGTDAASFNINTSTGEVTFKASPDFETKDTYSFDIEAQDISGYVSGASAVTKTVTLSITDVNEAPVFSSTDSAGVSENAAISTVIYTAQASDVDTNDAITYSLGGTDAASFNINASSGEVTLKASADYETKNSYAIEVTATDKDGLTDTQAMAINVADVNDDPSISSVASASIDENVNPTTVVHKVTATDQDGDTLTYTLTGTDAAAFTIDASSGEIKLKASADYETKNSYSIDVTATDDGSGTLSDTQTITVNIKDVNDAPEVSSSLGGVSDNQGAVINVDLSTDFRDDDAGDTATFTMSGAPESLTLATNGTLSGTLTNADVGDHSITITCTDAAGLDVSDTFVLTVVNVNDSPVISSGNSATVAENTDTSTVLYTATATDIDVGDTISYSLTGTDASKFAIDASTGVVTLNTAADFETQSSYSINVVATDDSGVADTESDTQAVTISVNDVNEAPVITSAASDNVDENAVNSTVVYTASATDVDSDAISYSLGGTDAASFNIDATSGEVTLKTSADYETKASYNIDVIATDNGTGTLYDTQTVTISINDINDAPVITSAASTSVDENAATSTVVYAAKATDADGHNLTYSLGESKDEALFAIDPSSGEVTLIASANFEIKSSYDIDVIATDDGTGLLEDTQTVSISVNDMNEAPTATASISNATVDEDAALTAIDASAAFTDVDAGETLSYSLDSDSAEVLTIDSSTGIITGTPTNDAVGTHTVTVTATDASGLTATTSFTLTTNNTNDAPTVTSIANVAVAEDTTIAPIDAGAAFTDVDVDDTLTFSLDAASDETLDIDADGLITGSVTNDEVGTHTVTVTATDSTGETASTSFQFTVTNANDAPIMTSGTTASVNENAATSTVIYTATATDADVGSILTYSLGGADANSFDIDASSGEVTLKASADFETKATYNVDVIVTDNGEIQLTDSQSVVVSINDINDAPVLAEPFGTVTIMEDEPQNENLALDFSDPDSGDTISFTMTGAPSSLALSSAGLLTGTPTNADVGSHTVTITCTDAAGLSTSDTFTMVISNTNDAPSITSAASASVAENAATTTVVYTVTATDPDTGDTLTYSLSGTDKDLFNIDASSGEVTLIASADFEAKASYSINVIATDDGTGALDDTLAVTVNVTDENEAPELAAAFGTINLTQGEVQNEDLTQDFSDPDANDTITYSMSGAPSSLTLSAGGLLTGTPTNDDVGSHTVTISGTDAAGLSTSDTFTMVINNTNDAPSITSAVTANVDENAATTTVVYTATATDIDTGDTITYSLGNSKDEASFNIDASSGEVTLIASADFETKDTYAIDVIATDDGTGTLADTQAVTVSVNDVNDVATGSATISGTAMVGKQLSTDVTGIVDEDGLDFAVYTHQWVRVASNGTETNITSATSSTYTLTNDDIGFTVKDIVGFTDDGGNVESINSTTSSTIVDTVKLINIKNVSTLTASEASYEINNELKNKNVDSTSGSQETIVKFELYLDAEQVAVIDSSVSGLNSLEAVLGFEAGTIDSAESLKILGAANSLFEAVIESGTGDVNPVLGEIATGSSDILVDNDPSNDSTTWILTEQIVATVYVNPEDTQTDLTVNFSNLLFGTDMDNYKITPDDYSITIDIV